jgi:hypothetical protein
METIEIVATAIEKQMRALVANGQMPRYVVLDKDTWKNMVLSKNRGGYVVMSYERPDPTLGADTICGLPVTVLSGMHEVRVIEVVV